MAPEMSKVKLLKDKRNGVGDGSGYDKSVDIWAVGVVAYELRFGDVPHDSMRTFYPYIKDDDERVSFSSVYMRSY